MPPRACPAHRIVLSTALIALAGTPSVDAAPSTATAESRSVDAETSERLEKRLNDMRRDRQPESRFQPRFSGFLNAGVSHDANATGYAAQDDETDVGLNSLVGLQGRFRLADTTHVTLQAVARGRDEWQPEVEWAMLSHAFGNGLAVRVGRLRVPLFMYSDYLEVGYAQPWARPPQEVYGMVPISSFHGGDILYDMDLGGGTLSLQGFAGAAEDDYRFTADKDVDFELDNLWGGAVSWTNDALTLRVNAARADVSMQEPAFRPPLSVDDPGWFAGVGARWDAGNWLLVGELTRIEVDTSHYPNTDAGYLTAGYRFGPVVPYLTFAAVASRDDEARAGTPYRAFDLERRATTVGARWDVMPRVAIKAEVVRADGLSGTWGGLGGNLESMLSRGRFAFGDATVATLAVHAVF